MRQFLRRSLFLGALLAPQLMLAQGVGAPGATNTTLFRGGRIDRPGSYILARSLEDMTTAIHITSDAVTLDLNGHQLLGPGGLQGVGVRIEGADGVEIRNGNIANFGFGVIVESSNNVVLRNLRIRGQGIAVTAPPPEVGVMIVQSKNVVVENNSIFSTGLGIFVRGGQSWGNRIQGNTVTAGANGLLGICYNPAPNDPMGPRGDLIHDNVITGFNTGIQASDMSMYNVFQGNTISYRTAAMDLRNDTNQDLDNVSVPFP